MLACDNCFIFHIAEEQTATELALVGLALLGVLAATAFVIAGFRSHGRRRAGAWLSALGVLLVPVSFVPLVQVVILGPTSVERNTALGPRVVTIWDHVDCDKPLTAAWNYQTDPRYPDRSLAAVACRSAAHDAYGRNAVLLAVATACLLGGASLRRRPPERDGTATATDDVPGSAVEVG